MPWDPIPGPFLFSYRLCTPTAAQHKHSRVRLSNVSTKTSTPIGDHDRTNHLDAYRLSLLHLYRLGVISYEPINLRLLTTRRLCRKLLQGATIGLHRLTLR